MRVSRVVEALFSLGTLWTLVSVGAGAVAVMWLRWAFLTPHTLPLVPAVLTWLLSMVGAWVAESRDREARRLAIRRAFRYHGVTAGMHVWLADHHHPLVTHDLASARLAVIMPAEPDPAEPPDVAIDIVR